MIIYFLRTALLRLPEERDGVLDRTGAERTCVLRDGAEYEG